MKTTEEKAKAYDEAFERAKQIRNGNPSSGTAIVVCEEIFPELAESEDEKIRKEIIKFIQDFCNPCDPDCDKWVAYLERQKEQKPTSFNEPYNPDEYEVVVEGNATSLKRKEQKPVEWSEEDTLMITAIIQTLERFEGRGTTGMQIDWLKSLRPQTKPSWKPSEEQMEALRNAVNKLANTDVADSVRLSIMYDNLKKL